MNRSTRSTRDGLTLLEVVLALAIMGIAMAIINNSLALGAESAAKSRFRSLAQVLCDTKMSEISAGVLPLDGVNMASIAEKPDWSYSVEIRNSDLTGLLSVTVSVQPAHSSGIQYEPYILTRLVPDPNYEPEQALVQ